MSHTSTRAQLITRYCVALRQYRWWILVVAIGFVIAMASGGVFLERTADNRVFFGERNPQFQAFQALESTYTESNNVLIAVAPRSGDVFTPERLELIRSLTETLWRAPYAIRVDSITNFQHTRGTPDEIIVGDLVPGGHTLNADEIAQIRTLALSEPLLSGLLIAPDGDVAGINVNFQLPSEAPSAVNEIVDFLRAVTEEYEQAWPDIELHMTGNVMIMSTFAEAGDYGEGPHDRKRHDHVDLRRSR